MPALMFASLAERRQSGLHDITNPGNRQQASSRDNTTNNTGVLVHHTCRTTMYQTTLRTTMQPRNCSPAFCINCRTTMQPQYCPRAFCMNRQKHYIQNDEQLLILVVILVRKLTCARLFCNCIVAATSFVSSCLTISSSSPT